MIGTVMMVAAAVSPPQFTSSKETKLYTAIGKVIVFLPPEDQHEDEVVPRRDEAEDGRGDDAWLAERQDDPHESADA